MSNPDQALILITTLPIDQNPAAVYLASLTSHQSRIVMTSALRTLTALLTGRDREEIAFADVLSLNWSALRYQHAAALRTQLIDLYSPATANRLLSALRGTLKQAWKLGHMSAEDYRRAVDVANIKAETLPAGRELAQGELLALVGACKQDKTPAGVRDAAIIGLLYTCGLRRGELATLHVNDFAADTGQLKVKKGKGRKQRTVYVTGGALAALTHWLTLMGRTEGPLFAPILKSGVIQGSGLGVTAIYKLLKKRGEEAGVKAFSPHDFRRTFVSDLLDRQVDIATIASIAGHTSIDTTKRYDRRPEPTKKQAANKLHFPY